MNSYDPDSIDELMTASCRRLAALREASDLSDNLRRKAVLCDDARGEPTNDSSALRSTADTIDSAIVAVRRAEFEHARELERGIPNREEDRRLHGFSLSLAHVVEQMEAVEAEC